VTFQIVTGNQEAGLIEENKKRKPENKTNTETTQPLKNPIDLIQTVIDAIEGEVFIKDAKGKYLKI
jgi:hypothetical protein